MSGKPPTVTLAYAAATTPAFRLRPSRPLVFVWLPLALLTMLLAWRGCVSYNAVAGTDLSCTEIARIVAAMNLGPFVGPLQSSSGFNETFYRRLVPVPVALLVAGWLPFARVRRPVRMAWAVAAWVLNVVAAMVWYAAALMSFAFYLS